MKEHKKNAGMLLKRMLLVCLSLILVFGSALTIIAATLPGDINGDEKVTAFDAQMLAEYQAGKRELTAEQLLQAAGLTIRNIINTILGRTESEPSLDEGVEETFKVNVENGIVTEEKSVTVGGVTVTVPAGVAVEGESLTLSVQKLDAAEGGVTVEEGQEQILLDIHVEGVAPHNSTPVIIYVAEALEAGLNEGNVELYHVENGEPVPMTQYKTVAELTEHNRYCYDPATGDVTVAMASFSAVALVSDIDKAWEGNYDYSWYEQAMPKRNGKAADYVIANADQLAGLSAIVGGMAGRTQDSFSNKTVKLVADVNFGGESNIFYPIGYYNDEGTYEKSGKAITSGFKTFEGEFDGQGHTISNIYQNTWSMKGDNEYYAATEQNYRDGMGLFGKVYGGTVKNLTVKDFSSDGEYTTTGVIAAYADSANGKSAVFENIAIVNCNPRVYNIGNGGIVGCGGWYAQDDTTVADKPITFRNITVDGTNKISALWGSWDVACGGIMGQYYPNNGCGVSFENCHVAAQIDVFNDVCANYQYYAYRYAGMMIGSIRENETVDGHVYPKMDGITAEDCTVHFDTWNDYFYCELVANSLASYTHDHQFSRLDMVDAVDAEKMTVTIDGETTDIPKEGRYNYVVVEGTYATENATCYHFVDGKVHNHADYNGDGQDDYETVNGESVLVENNQHIYLPFSQLFTGYGWGVTSKGLTDYEGIATMDITSTEQKDSVEKFQIVDDVTAAYGAGVEINISDLFEAKDQQSDKPVAIDTDNVQVFVSPVGTLSTVSGTYVPDTDNWEQGKLTFSGRGAATVTITDYHYCIPTTLDIVVLDGDYYIAAERTNAYWYMDKTDANDHYTAVKTQSDKLPSVITQGDAAKTFKFIAQDDGTFKIMSGDEYLGYNSGNTGILVTEDNAKKSTITFNAEENTFNIFFAVNDTETRYLSLNASNSNYFAWYKGTQLQDLSLIPVQPCEHTNQTTSSKDATCEEVGFTDRITCDDCEQVLEEGSVVPATGHDFDEETGACQNPGCDVTKPEDGGETESKFVEMPLADINADDVVVITMTNANTVYALTNGGGTSSAPVATKVTVEEDKITSDVTDNLKWNITNDNGNLTIYPAGQTATWLYCTSTNNGVRVGTNAAKVFTFDTDSGYLKHTGTGRYVGVYTTNPDWRCYTSTTTNIGGQTLKFYVLSEGGESGGGEVPCTHPNTTTETVDATCVDDGSVTVTCDDCGETVSTETIPATGHNYVDGVCSNCDEPDPDAGTSAPKNITFEFGAIGTAEHKDGSSNQTTYTETVDGYTLNLTDGTNMFPSSYDAKGNSCIKLGTSSKTGGFSFTVPEDVTSVTIKIAKYKDNTTKVLINGTTHTLTKNSNDGAYDEIIIDTSTNKTVTLITVSGGVRAMVNSIIFVVPEN